MKRKLITLILAGAMCLSIASCSNKSVSSSVNWSKYVTLADYSAIEFKVQDPAEITDEQINEQIDYILSQNATLQEVTGRAVKEGDTVNIDYEGKKDGVAFDGGTATGYDLTIGSGSFIDGFEDGLVGAQIGETRDLNLTFPEDYSSEELAGQEVVFTVKVNKIQESVTPELTDEFVQSVSTKSKTVDEFKEEVRASLLENAKTQAESTAISTYWQSVLDNSQIDEYPKNYIENKEKETKKTYEDLASNNDMTLEEYLEANYSMTVDEFNEQISQSVSDSAKQTAVLRALCADMGIKLTDDEYKEKAENYVYQAGVSSLEVLEKQYTKDYIEDLIYWEKLQDKLLGTTTEE